MTDETLRAPFPWFGGKSRVAPQVWRLFGTIPNYVEPFFGSGAILLGRPGGATGTETINDKDGFVANFWRAVQHDALTVAKYADWPANENDLHARHVWLRGQKTALVARLGGDPEYCDAKIAGWWVLGLAQWIGGGFCGEGGTGPWEVVDGQLVHLGDAGQGVSRRLVHLGDAGRGVSRRLVHLGDAGRGVSRKLVHLGAGRGVSRRRIRINDTVDGDNREGLMDWFLALKHRLRRVRVCCGEWHRVLGPAVTTRHGVTGIFLDPPYGTNANRDKKIYACDSEVVAGAVREWAVAHGDDPLMRIILCGYEGEHQMPSSWTCIPWKTQGGYASLGQGVGLVNATRERLWCSPHCREPLPLFAER